MADVGLDAELQLDIASALSAVDQVEAALSAATTQSLDLDYLPSVSSFADALAGAVADVTATPVDVPVVADTTEADQQVAALGGVPVDVPIEADTIAAAAEIQGLESSVPAIDIPVEADTTEASAALADIGDSASTSAGGVDALDSSVAALGATVAVTGGSAKELVGVFGEMGGAETAAAAGGILAVSAATAGFFEEGLNAVSAGQRFDLVLGDMGESIKRIDVNGLNVSMKDLGIQFGSTESEMENVNSKLFQNAINAGVSRDKAEEFTKQIETLAARAISLNPTLGTLDQVASGLGDKLARGGRFAQNYGIQLTAAEIATRALSDTGKATAADLTIVEKSIAGAELASEKYGTTLATTVAEGSKNAAVQAESLKASFKEAIEQIGVPLVAPVLDLIREAEPDAVLIAETLGHLASEVLPLVANTLTLIGPPLEVLTTLIDLIPGPAIQAGVAFLAMSKGITLVGNAVGVAELKIPALAVTVAAIAGAVAIWTAVTGNDTAAQEAHNQEIEHAKTALDDLSKPLQDRITDAITGTDAYKKLAPALAAAGISIQDIGKHGELTGPQIAKLNTEAGKLGLTSADVREGLDGLTGTVNEAARQTLIDAVATGKLTQEQVIQASHTGTWSEALANATLTMKGLTTATGETVPIMAGFSGVLQGNQTDVDQFWNAVFGGASKSNEFKDAVDSNLIQPMTTIVLTLDDLKRGGVDMVDSFSKFAIAVNDPRLTDSDLQAVADQLGISLDDLKGFAKEAQQAVVDLVNAAQKNVPTIADVFSGVKDKISANSILTELQKQLTDIQQFTDNVNLLITSGLANTAKAALEGGPEVAAALAQPVKDGNAQTQLELEAGFQQFDSASKNLKDNIDNVWGPELADATGTAGANASKLFRDKFKPQDAVGPAMAAVVAGIQTGTPEAEGAAQTSASVTASVYGATLQTQTHAQAQAGFASGASSGIVAGQDVVGQVAQAAGVGIGGAMGLGMVAGLIAQRANIETTARNIASGAAAAARAALQISSPSQVFVEIGQQVGAGLALGLSDTADVDAAAANLLAVASPTLPAASPSLPSSARGGAGADLSELVPLMSRLVSLIANQPPQAVPMMQIGSAVFGSSGAADDVDWFVRTKMAGV